MRASYTKAGAGFLETLERETSVHWRGGQKPTHLESYGEIMLSSEGLKTSSMSYRHEEGYTEVSQDEFLFEVKKRFPKKDSGMGIPYYTKNTQALWDSLKFETSVTWLGGSPLKFRPEESIHHCLVWDAEQGGLAPGSADRLSREGFTAIMNAEFLDKMKKRFPKKDSEDLNSFCTRYTPELEVSLRKETMVYYGGVPFSSGRKLHHNTKWVFYDGTLTHLTDLGNPYLDESPEVSNSDFVRRVKREHPKKADETSTADAVWGCEQWGSTTGRWSSTSQPTDDEILLLL